MYVACPVDVACIYHERPTHMPVDFVLDAAQLSNKPMFSGATSSPGGLKPAFHDADSDTDFLARILADSPDTPSS